jgi:hypothetical protein
MLMITIDLRCNLVWSCNGAIPESSDGQVKDGDNAITPLHSAARAGTLAIVQLLIEAGADITKADKARPLPRLVPLDPPPPHATPPPDRSPHYSVCHTTVVVS